MRILMFAAMLAAAAPTLAQTADYSQHPALAGRWTYQARAGGSDARFLDASNFGRATLSCDKGTRRVTISRTSAVAASSLSIWTTDSSRAIPSAFDQAGQRVYSTLAAQDALLDGIAFSRGRFVIGMAGGQPPILPAWPEAARVIEDCRI